MLILLIILLGIVIYLYKKAAALYMQPETAFSILMLALSGLLLLLGLFYLFWRFWFLRDPERLPPQGKNIVSPADGRVMAVYSFSLPKNPVSPGRHATHISIRKGNRSIDALASDVSARIWVVSIFMSPLDVHVNRSPCEGRVLYTRHTPGSFNPAGNIKKSMENEKNEILIKAPFGKLKVIQIAGFLARRIVCSVSEGQRLSTAQRIGLINLGSQVTVLIPRDRISLRVRKGSRVRAGESVIGVYR